MKYGPMCEIVQLGLITTPPPKVSMPMLHFGNNRFTLVGFESDPRHMYSHQILTPIDSTTEVLVYNS